MSRGGLSTYVGIISQGDRQTAPGQMNPDPVYQNAMTVLPDAPYV